MTVQLGGAGSGVVACLRFEKPGLALIEPGATFTEAGLTMTGLTLMGGREQMEGWGTDFPSVALADSDSDWSGKSDKRGQKSAISVDS